MNSKKALKNIRDYHNETVYDTDSIYTENIFEKELDAIEKDLERLEKLEKAIKILEDNLSLILFNANPYELYAEKFGYRYLTQEEYEILKEVLGNEYT